MFRDLVAVAKASGGDKASVVSLIERVAGAAKDGVVAFETLDEADQKVLAPYIEATKQRKDRVVTEAHLVAWMKNRKLAKPLVVENVLVAGSSDLTEEEISCITGTDKTECIEEVNQLLSKYLSEEEGELSSSTATALRDQLRDEKMFKKFEDEDWLEFGKFIKSKGVHASVFTGVLAALIRYLIKSPRALPTTSHYAERKVFNKGNGIKLTKFTGSKAMGVLEREHVIQAVSMTAKQGIRSALHTARDKKFRDQFPRTMMDIWFVDDVLRDILSYLRGKKVRIKAESDNTTANLLEILTK